MLSANNDQSGFTLVELVVVIIVLSIVSVYAASRYMGASSFSAYAAQEQAISIIRQIQLSRMQSNIDSTATLSSDYQLRVTSSCLGSVSSCTASGDSRSNKLVLPDELSFAQTMTVNFDLLGNPSCATGTCPAEFKVDLSSTTETLGVCINSQGYIYAC